MMAPMIGYMPMMVPQVGRRIVRSLFAQVAHHMPRFKMDCKVTLQYCVVFISLQAYFPYMQGAMQQQQQQQAPAQQYPLPQSVLAQLIQAGLLNGQEIRIEGLPQDALGPVAMALANLRQRRVGGQQQQQAGVQMGGFNARPPRRLRVINLNLNLSIRTLLQILVFAMVMYQHFTWRRFALMMIGSLVMYVAATWEPLRRAVAALQQPPPAPAPRPVPAAPGAGDGVNQGGVEQQQPENHAAAAAPGAPRPPNQRLVSS